MSRKNLYRKILTRGKIIGMLRIVVCDDDMYIIREMSEIVRRKAAETDHSIDFLEG